MVTQDMSVGTTSSRGVVEVVWMKQRVLKIMEVLMDMQSGMGRRNITREKVTEVMGTTQNLDTSMINSHKDGIKRVKVSMAIITRAIIISRVPIITRSMLRRVVKIRGKISRTIQTSSLTRDLRRTERRVQMGT